MELIVERIVSKVHKSSSTRLGFGGPGGNGETGVAAAAASPNAVPSAAIASSASALASVPVRFVRIWSRSDGGAEVALIEPDLIPIPFGFMLSPGKKIIRFVIFSFIDFI